MRRRLRLLVLGWALLLVAHGTVAAPVCPEDMSRWVAECARERNLQARIVHCPTGGVVVEVDDAEGGALRVEVARAREGAFLRVGEFSVSPVGNFADWKAEPKPTRDAFDAIAQCVKVTPPSFRAGKLAPGGEVGRVAERSPPATPWCAALALVLAGACAVGAARRRLQRTASGVAGLAGLAAACFALRWSIAPHAFFHQNGQGPYWIHIALRGGAKPPTYGPGYGEVFGWVARIGAESPELAVFTAQALLGSLMAPSAWVMARSARAPRALAGALALAVTVDPTLARVVQSESYFGLAASLLFLACAALASGAYRGSLRSPRFMFGAVIAGLLVAQAARVHPIAWVPAAAVPLIVLVGRGRLRTRALLAVAATGTIAITVVLFAGREMRGVLAGELGKQWMPSVREAIPIDRVLQAAVLIILTAVAVRFVRHRAVVALVVGSGTIALAVGTDLLGAPNVWVGAAYERLFAPTLVAASAAVLACDRPARVSTAILAISVVSAATLHATLRFRDLTSVPTDALEAAWIVTRRAELPRGATVAYVGGAGSRITTLPFYEGVAWSPHPKPLAPGAPLPLPMTQVGETFYVQTSLCATPDARELCAEFARKHTLEPIESVSLPAVPSMHWFGYDSDTVEVALFRVRGPRQPP